MVDYCDKNHGTSLTIYDTIKWIMDALHDVVDDALPLLRIGAQTLVFLTPDNFPLPIMFNTQNAVPQIPVKRFYGLGVSYNSDIGIIPIHYSNVFYFPKEPLSELWRAFVRPSDYIIPGSGSWPYVDPLDGEIRQGNICTPPQDFGILGRLPQMAKWGFIIYFIIKIIGAIGINVSQFVQKLTLRRKYDSIIDGIVAMHADLKDMNQWLGISVANMNDEIISRLDTLSGVLGVRLSLM